VLTCVLRDRPGSATRVYTYTAGIYTIISSASTDILMKCLLSGDSYPRDASSATHAGFILWALKRKLDLDQGNEIVGRGSHEAA
jgi:hypothetical protein